jgi:DNA polymerase-4
MSRWPRQILFGDVDAMYASSAIIANPALDGKMVAVGTPPPRGIITAAVYALRRHGIKAAMPTAHALRLCPDLVLVPPDRTLYRRLNQRMQVVTDRLFPATDWTSIDEFYADTTDLQSMYASPADLGKTVKNAIHMETGLRCTVAIATGKTVAKVAADCHKPDGLAVVEPGTEAAFMAAQPVKALPGVGPKTAAMLDQFGVRRVRDLYNPELEPALRHLWGPRLLALQALGRGIDSDPVVPNRERKSLSHETTFDEDTTDLEVLEQALFSFLGCLAHDLRQEQLAATSFTIKLKDSQFNLTTRQRHFPEPLNYDPRMWRAIKPALRLLAVPKTSYRLVGLTLSGLVPAMDNLFEQRTGKALAAVDQLIERFGMGAIRIGGIPD